jgi:hypothetical protein
VGYPHHLLVLLALLGYDCGGAGSILTRRSAIPPQRYPSASVLITTHVTVQVFIEACSGSGGQVTEQLATRLPHEIGGQHK